MKHKKSSSGNTAVLHPYIADYINTVPPELITERARLREGWTTWGNVKKKDGRVISFKIITKTV